MGFLRETSLFKPESAKDQIQIFLLCPFASFVVKLSFPHIKADCRSGRHPLSCYGRLPQDNPRLVSSIAVITAADDTHLAQCKAAFDQRNVCIRQRLSYKAGHHITLAIIGGSNQQAYFW